MCDNKLELLYISRFKKIVVGGKYKCKWFETTIKVIYGEAEQSVKEVEKSKCLIRKIYEICPKSDVVIVYYRLGVKKYGKREGKNEWLYVYRDDKWEKYNLAMATKIIGKGQQKEKEDGKHG